MAARQQRKVMAMNRCLAVWRRWAWAAPVMARHRVSSSRPWARCRCSRKYLATSLIAIETK